MPEPIAPLEVAATTPVIMRPAEAAPVTSTAVPLKRVGPDLGWAAISIATAVVVLLTALDATFLLENQLFAVVAAAVVSLGSATGIFRLFHRGFRSPGRWLSAVGGVALLGGGLVHTLSQFSTVGVVGQVLLLNSTLVIPLAALLSFLGGVLQLPARWGMATFTAVGGAVLCSWFSLGPGSSPLLCGLGAAATVAGVVLGLLLARHHTAELIPREVLRKLWSVLIGSAVVCAMVSCLLAATILPDTGWGLLLTPGEAVWGFFAATVLLAVNALRYSRGPAFSVTA